MSITPIESTPGGPFTRDEFLHGRPEAMVQANQLPKVLVVWPHSDETLAPEIAYHIQTEEPELLAHVDYVCGNPRAASQDPPIRYVETDLNRSFKRKGPGESKSYEDERGELILDQTEAGGYEYVLDVHTSTVDVGRFFLANHRNEAVDTIIAASPITRIVMMPDQIAQAGLIGQVPNSVSVEYDREVAAEVGVEESMTLIRGLIRRKSLVTPQDREFYYVTGAIPKTEDPGLDARNFELCKDGYYPVLFGENSYRKDPTKTYLGFAATSREIAVL